MTCVGDFGIVALTQNEIIINQQLHAFLPGKLVDSLFLATVLRFQKKYFSQVATKTAVPYLNKENCNSTPIPVPSIQEQQNIAKAISTWDNAIEKTNQLIAAKEQRKKWLMQQLLTGKKRLKGYGNDKWQKFSYHQLLKEVYRPIQWNDNELYKLISVRRRSGGIFLREALFGHQIKVKDLRTAQTGDFLFSKMQILHGASALVTKEFNGAKISGSYIAVVAKDPRVLQMEFLNWYSKLPYFYHQTYISSYGVTIEKMTFQFDYFLQLSLNLPSIAEQKAIVNILEAADKEINLLKQKLEAYKEQKKGLMQVLLTGKVRLKVKN